MAERQTDMLTHCLEWWACPRCLVVTQQRLVIVRLGGRERREWNILSPSLLLLYNGLEVWPWVNRGQQMAA